MLDPPHSGSCSTSKVVCHKDLTNLHVCFLSACIGKTQPHDGANAHNWVIMVHRLAEQRKGGVALILHAAVGDAHSQQGACGHRAAVMPGNGCCVRVRVRAMVWAARGQHDVSKSQDKAPKPQDEAEAAGPVKSWSQGMNAEGVASMASGDLDSV